MLTRYGLAAFLLLVVPLRGAAQTFDAANAAQVIFQMKNDVIAMARQIEDIYASRCNASTLLACEKANYDACRSRYPDLSCPAGAAFTDPECGNGETCSALWDFSNSVVIVSGEGPNGSDGNPTDPLVIESVCVTRLLDDWFRKKTATDQSFWDGYGISFPPFYFGGQSGYTRYYPGIVFRGCSSFDPRNRPWYAAATSGPKNIILLLDTSSDMVENGKLDLLKQTAQSLVQKLSVGDRIALVPFNDNAAVLGSNGGYLNTATADNKNAMLAMIDGLSAQGGMNLIGAYTKAFDVLELSAKAGYTVDCHSAIVLLSGGQATQVASTTLLGLISNRTDELKNVVNGKVITFVYSIAPGDQGVDPILKEIACATEYGVWSNVTSNTTIAASLESFYLVFALGLGNDDNMDFVAWAEPYVYVPTPNIGTTVSAPVYDRSKDPHIFLGIAAVDFLLTALNIALGETGNDTVTSVARIVAAATSVCPKLDLPPCVVESLRRSTSGEPAQCGNSNCTGRDLAQVREEKCPGVNQYPASLWNNTDQTNTTYVDRACCKVGENVTSATCRGTSQGSARAYWGLVTGFMLLAIIGV